MQKNHEGEMFIEEGEIFIEVYIIEFMDLKLRFNDSQAKP